MSAPIDMFAAHVERIMWPIVQYGQPVNRMLNSASEGRLYQKELRAIQAQLRSVKRDINLHMKAMRLNYGSARTGASNHPILGMIAGRRVADHARATDRQVLRTQEHNELLPYRTLLDHIDRHIHYVDSLKLSIDQAIQSSKLR